jgi:hypothetical protein
MRGRETNERRSNGLSHKRHPKHQYHTNINHYHFHYYQHHSRTGTRKCTNRISPLALAYPVASALVYPPNGPKGNAENETASIPATRKETPPTMPARNTQLHRPKWLKRQHN